MLDRDLVHLSARFVGHFSLFPTARNAGVDVLQAYELSLAVFAETLKRARFYYPDADHSSP